MQNVLDLHISTVVCVCVVSEFWLVHQKTTSQTPVHVQLYVSSLDLVLFISAH